VLRLPDLGGCGRCFKQPPTPKTHHVLAARLRTPANRRSEKMLELQSRPFLFLCSQLSTFCFHPLPPRKQGGGGWLPILSITMALPIVRTHILALPIRIRILIPIFPPLNSAPRTTSSSRLPHPKIERSCLRHGRKKLFQGQCTTASNLAAESCTPE
jgi:hypothetical protein